MDQTDIPAVLGDPNDIPTFDPPVRRLNPKLTARRPMPPTESEESSIVSEEYSVSATDDDLLSENATTMVDYNEQGRLEASATMTDVVANPNRHLLHPGRWIKKDFKLGRAIKRTGMWSCCGDIDSRTMYCPSIESRTALKKQIKLEEKEKIDSENRVKRIQETIKEPWEKQQLGYKKEHEVITEQQVAIENASSHKSYFNAAMLVPWIYKNIDDEKQVQLGVDFMIGHTDTGDGCKLLVKHGALGVLVKAHGAYKNKHSSIELSIVTCLRRLLECNFTRDQMTNLDTLKIAFYVGYFYHHSKIHAEMSMYCILQLSINEHCRVKIIELNIINYATEWSRKHSKVQSIIKCLLKLFNWVSTSDDKMEYLVDCGCVSTTLQCIKRHFTNSGIISAGILFLTRSSKKVPAALEWILRKKAVPTVINALRALYYDDELQYEGLLMMRSLSKTSEGWKQISETRGAWQALCQGTTLGDALVHDLPGEFNNPGWAIGDTPHLPVADRQRIIAVAATAAQSHSSSGTSAKSAWSSTALKQYMGISLKELKLSINNEYHDNYFNVICTLDLLPKPHEESVHWFKRIADYEVEMDIKLEDMVNTIIEMKKSEEQNKKDLEEVSKNRAYVKPVVVMGHVVTAKLLEEKDLSVEELQAGMT